ncbi:hypothetical protein [Streptomyces malaysiensis]|uniref:Uncharacterized protein n=1 Tax=Streptomyces malaysiensis subsp. samsunensis TaxID=459658 RepID=A0A9X2MAE2_STRMQ|nr:hypothetical protein [Streptomyces samsunensis]MCQ8836104.1 hypothetical protein [Streptomyces samsunensis]
MTDTVSIPADVAHAFTDAWCTTVITSDVAASLGCTEVDTLAHLLRALGAEQAADEWTDAHAEGDEPTDRHFQGTVPAESSLAVDGMRWSPAPADAQDEQ